MRKVVLALLFLTSSAAAQTVLAGDVGAGQSAFASKGCIGCHGSAGKNPTGENPVIGGKSAEFITAELIKFRSGERTDPLMNAMTASLSDADIANLAAYLSSQ